eukprot:SAG31_NODE_30813_length_375_cov_5.264493_1_plen_60_part_01
MHGSYLMAMVSPFILALAAMDLASASSGSTNRHANRPAMMSAGALPPRRLVVKGKEVFSS